MDEISTIYDDFMCGRINGRTAQDRLKAFIAAHETKDVPITFPIAMAKGLWLVIAVWNQP